ncbi:hypothetical protein TRFO_29962 [Tritrichomonas foetus]|uniref:TOG domain-containing protein n=1 Tax=Tritrichomonas foetus TaxID=1144522 RepID=A0A1J4JWF5_9EUKA|nr:hypothetical protein TRFO_29962 [Tritrichomonas foetus]|eukprot:OHT02776.1 hypothetical protein TRFO_29962 [Tritrichomonas foetus]
MQNHEDLLYGLLPFDQANLPHAEMISAIEKILHNYSYSDQIMPDFPGLFKFIVTKYEKITDSSILSRVMTVLSDIGGYRSGISIAKLIHLVEPISIRLLSEQNVSYVKVAVDFYRKIGRITGPRFIFKTFIEPNSNNEAILRSLTIIVIQSINDSPNFDFQPDDFGEWVKSLGSVVGVGPRLLQTIKSRVGDIAEFDNIPDLPLPNLNVSTNSPFNSPLTPNIGSTRIFSPNNSNLSPAANIPSSPNQSNNVSFSPIGSDSNSPSTLLNSSSRSKFSRTLPPGFHQANKGRPNTQNPVFQMTPKQQQVRKFNDSPFDEDQDMNEVVRTVRTGIKSKEWDDRCSSYNLSRRILKYSTSSLNDDDIHELVTTILEDITGSRAALSLASIGALQELFIRKTEEMEFELARVLPVLLRLHAKTAQFFETPLSQCCSIVVNTMPSKRMCSVLLSNGESKAPKIQAAIAKLYCDSLIKCNEKHERFFSKTSDEFGDMIKTVNNLLNGSTHPTRQSAKEAVHQLYLLFENDLLKYVPKFLNDHDANQFLQNV